MKNSGRFKQPFDIRVYKRRIRENCKSARKAMLPEQKILNDAAILSHLTSSNHYRNCKTLLCYVSTASEVDTRTLIERALSDGKRVAVPYCIDGTRDLHFYLIGGLHELIPRTFGVLEPVPEKSRKLVDFSASMCIVPGLCFDRAGYRLGYGGGYYDRFLNKYGGISVGICHHQFLRQHLVRGRYDVACQYIITESGIIRAYKKHPPRPIT